MHDIKSIRDTPDAFDAALKRRGINAEDALRATNARFRRRFADNLAASF